MFDEAASVELLLVHKLSQFDLLTICRWLPPSSETERNCLRVTGQPWAMEWSAKKTQFCTSEATYLRCQLRGGKRSLSQSRITAILQNPTPKAKRHFQQFLVPLGIAASGYQGMLYFCLQPPTRMQFLCSLPLMLPAKCIQGLSARIFFSPGSHQLSASLIKTLRILVMLSDHWVSTPQDNGAKKREKKRKKETHRKKFNLN